MADVDGPGVVIMSISLEKTAEKYLVAKKLSAGTRKEYRSTVTKWLSIVRKITFCSWVLRCNSILEVVHRM